MSLHYLVKPSCSKIDLVSKCNDYKLTFLQQFMPHIYMPLPREHQAMMLS